MASNGELLMNIHLNELGVHFKREYQFHPERKWRLDFYVPLYNVGIEVEGGIHVGGRHTRGKGYESDCEKYNAAVLMGIRLLRFTTGMVMDGRAIEAVKEALYGKN